MSEPYPKKPLGIKNYGSIAHFPGSRMGPLSALDGRSLGYAAG